MAFDPRSGYYFPLNAKRALDADYGVEYGNACAARARREPRSARNRTNASRQRAVSRIRLTAQLARAASEGYPAKRNPATLSEKNQPRARMRARSKV